MTIQNSTLFRIQLRNQIRTFLLLFAVIILPLYSLANTSLPSKNTFVDIQVVDGINNEPMIGVSVFADDIGKFAGTTNFEGKITIKNLEHRDFVNFTYVGYASKRIPLYQIRNNSGVIPLFQAFEVLDEVVVVGRTDAAENEIPYAVSKIDQEDIAFLNSQTSADALANSGDVYIQKSQMGGGSPIVRGFEANRVLLVLDGVRMNNAIYRNGHLQNSITVDNSMLEQIEVIHGPGALMYGSDALGGVVHFRSKEPKVLFSGNEDYEIASSAFLRYASANSEKTVHFDVDYKTRKWGSLTSFSYADYGDLRAGSKRPEGYGDFGYRRFYQTRVEQDMIIENNNPNLQVGTAFNQIDFTQKMRYQPNDSLYFILNLQYSTTSDVPRYDNLIDTLASADRLKYIEWYYGPQQRMMASLKTRILKPTAIYDRGTIIAAFQRIDEDRLSRKFRETHREFNLEDVYVYSLTADFDKNFGRNKQQVFSYGIDGAYNQVYSTAGSANINTGAIYNDADIYTRYPSNGSAMATAAAYANYRWKSRDSTLTIQGGLRYSYVNISASYLETDLVNWPTYYYDGISLINDAVNWGAGITWNSKNNWQIRVMAATAFRSPNIDDFGKMRIKKGHILVPNPELVPENSLSGEVTIAKQFGRMDNKGNGTTFKISGTGFYTHLTDAIVRVDSTLAGQSTLIFNDESHDVQKNVNAHEAFIYGGAANILFRINSTWEFKSGVNFTKGRNVITADSLIPFGHIPPMYGLASLSYRNEKLRIDGVVRFNGKKPIEEYDPGSNGDYTGTSDNADYGLIDEDGEFAGTYAWTTYNLYATYQFNEKLSISLNVENISDLHYRAFASGLSAPGRNFILSVRKNF